MTRNTQTIDIYCVLFRPLASFLSVLTLLLFLFFSTSAHAEKYAAIVMDAATGEVLHAESPDALRYPASLTKMMTLYMAFSAINAGKLTLDQQIPVSRHASVQAPSKLGLRPGQTIKVEHAIMALATKSANDAAVTLGEAIGGSEPAFAAMMTRTAHQIGMDRTTFQNASGLPNAKQKTTVRDMATLSRALIRNFPEYYHYFSKLSFNYKGTTHRNHNKLLGKYAGMDGLKTGFINASGFNLAASATRNGRRLITVVFGGPTGKWRDNRVAELMDRGFGIRGGNGPLIADASSKTKGSKVALAGVKMPPLPARKPGTMVASAQPNGIFEQGDAGEAGFTYPSVRSLGTLSLTTSANASEYPQQPQTASVQAAGNWGIQVGAFADHTAGQQAIARATQTAPDLLVNTVPQVVKVMTGKNAVYRARITGLNEAAAKSICVKLKQTGQGCVPIAPQSLM